MKKLLLLIQLFGIFYFAHSGGNEAIQADELWHEGKFAAALEIYEKLYSKHSSNPELSFKLGTCYLYTNKPEKALNNFIQAKKELTTNYHMYNQQASAAPVETYYMLGETYRYLNLPDSASKYYLLYQDNFDVMAPYNTSAALQKTFNTRMGKIKPHPYEFKNLYKLNSQAEEIYPVVDAKGELLVFASNRGKKEGEKDLVTGEYPFDLYYSIQSDGVWESPQKLDCSLSNNEHPFYLSPDGKVLFFGRYVKGEWHVFVSKYKNGEWGNAAEVDKRLANIKGLAISPNEKHAVLCIKKEEHTHLYHVNIDHGKWGKPTLIKTCYSEAGEINPTYYYDNNTLFYSTSGYSSLGYGGHDLYSIHYSIQKKWSDPVAVAYPLNSLQDEKSIAFDVNQNVFVDRRNASNGQDLYLMTGFEKRIDPDKFEHYNFEVLDVVELEKEIEVEVEVTEFEEEKEVEVEVEKIEVEETETEVEIEVVEFEEKEIEVEVVEFEEKEVSVGYVDAEEAKKLDKVTTIETETEVEIIEHDVDVAELSIAHLSDEDRSLLFKKVDEYKATRFKGKGSSKTGFAENDSAKIVDMIGISDLGTQIHPEDVSMNIFFEFNEYNVNTYQKNRLDTLANILLDHPEVRIEIVGHADAIGSAYINDKYARLRALSVRKYLLSKKIDSDRLIAYGKSNFYSAKAGSSPKSERARRVEIVLIE